MGEWGALCNEQSPKIPDKSMNDFDQEFFSELTVPLIQPFLIHMVAQFVEENNH